MEKALHIMVVGIGGGTYLREKTEDGNSESENMAGLGPGIGKKQQKRGF